MENEDLRNNYNHVVNTTIRQSLCDLENMDEVPYDPNKPDCEICQRALLMEHLAG